MRRALWNVCLFLLLAGTACAQSIHNIAVVSILSPGTGRIPLSAPCEIAAAFRNTGTSNENNVVAKATITTTNGVVIYRDSVRFNNWLSGEYRDTNFRDFTPLQKKPYTVCFSVELTDDEIPTDNEQCRPIDVRYDKDVKAEAIVFPVDTFFTNGSKFSVRARFANHGMSDLSNIRLRLQMRPCKNDWIYALKDSIAAIKELNVGTKTEFEFSTVSLMYGSGCFRLAAIAIYPDDADRTNDTAYSTITIVGMENDMKADSFIVPTYNAQRPGMTMTPEVSFTNSGNATQSSVAVQVVVRDPSGQTVYSDVVTSSNWPARECRKIKFKSFTIQKLGRHTVRAFIAQANNTAYGNDSLSRNFEVYCYQNVYVHSAVVPQENDKWQPVGFIPAARFAADYCGAGSFANILVRATIYSYATGTNVGLLDTLIPKINKDGKEILVQFPTKNQAFDIADLKTGNYRMTFVLFLDGDDIPSDNYKAVDFQIMDRAITNSVSLLKVLEPLPGSFADPTVHTVPTFSFMNKGSNDLQDIPTFCEISYHDGSVVYRDSATIAKLAAIDTTIVTFKSFDLAPTSPLGRYMLRAWCQYPADLSRTDDTASITFGRGFRNDIHVVGITSPKSGAKIKQQEWINLKAVFDWRGANAIGLNIPALFEIRSCLDSQLVFSTEGILPVVPPGSGMEFSQWKQWPVNTPPGCYFATLKAAYDPNTKVWLDDNYSDNEAVSVFEVVLPADIKHHSQAFSLEQNFPNPASTTTAISFSLKKAGYASLNIADVTGRTLIAAAEQYFTEGEHTLNFDVANLAAGIYTYELSFTSASGQTQRISRTLAIVR